MKEKQTDLPADNARVEVNIFGERFVIRGDAETGYISEVARLVDRRMRELNSQHKNLSKYKIAILTAINLADEVLQEKLQSENRPADEDQNQKDEIILHKTRQLITLLDEGLVGDSL